MKTLSIQLNNLTLGYDRHPAVHHLYAYIPEGSLLAIVGPNGAGKSTLLKALAGEMKPLQGNIDLGDITRKDIAYLPQQASIDRTFPVTVKEMVSLGLWHETGAMGRLTETGRQRVKEALAAVGLQGFDHRVIGSLSGGQFQRALFARLLIQDAQLILLDEPFNSVDMRTASDLMALLQEWHQQQRTIIAVLHDLEQVRSHFPHTMLLARELVAFETTANALCASNLLKARALTEAFDESAAVCEKAA